MTTDRLTPLVDYFLDLFRSPTHMATLGITKPDLVFDGDQELIPATPALAVEAGPLNRELSGIGGKGRTDNNSTIYVLCYVAKLQSVQLTQKAAREFAEKVMDIMHTDVTCDGLVTHGLVTSIEPGYSIRGGTLMRGARVTWQGLSKTLIA